MDNVWKWVKYKTWILITEEEKQTLGLNHFRYHQAKHELGKRFLLYTNEIYLPCFVLNSNSSRIKKDKIVMMMGIKA